MGWVGVGCPQQIHVEASRQMGMGRPTWASRQMGLETWLKLMMRRMILTSLSCWSRMRRLGSMSPRVVMMKMRMMMRREGMEEETPQFEEQHSWQQRCASNTLRRRVPARYRDHEPPPMLRLRAKMLPSLQS